MDAGRLRWAKRRILGEYNNERTPCQGEMARKFAKVTIWRQISGALSNKSGLCRFERVHARWQRKISDAKGVSWKQTNKYDRIYINSSALSWSPHQFLQPWLFQPTFPTVSSLSLAESLCDRCSTHTFAWCWIIFNWQQQVLLLLLLLIIIL